MIIVLGAARCAPERVDEAFALSREHVARSLAEPGCIAHAVHRDADDPTRLVFVERWRDRETLEAHFRVPASRDFGRRLAGFCVAPPSIELFEAASLPMPGRSSG